MKATFQADGDVIVITGGANGIGRELALDSSANSSRLQHTVRAKWPKPRAS